MWRRWCRPIGSYCAAKQEGSAAGEREKNCSLRANKSEDSRINSDKTKRLGREKSWPRE